MSPSTEHQPIVLDKDRFARESQLALAQLQESVRQVLAAAPTTAARPVDVERAFDLDAALAWQIHALATKTGLSLSARAVPKPGAMERFLLAAARIASEDVASSARAAYESFQRAVHDLAGDRETFDTILTLQSPQDGAALRRARRTAHRGTAAVWGVTCACTFHAGIFRQRPTGEHDCLSVRGHVGLQRLHGNAMVSLSASTRVWGGANRPVEGDPRVHVSQVELIEDACSRPIPRVERVFGPDGSFWDFLTSGGLGKRSQVSVAWRTTSLDFPGGTSKPPHGITSGCLVPTELSVVDLLVPRGWVDGRTIRTWITPDPARFGPVEPGSRFQMAFEGAGQRLGTSLTDLYSPVAPQYADIIRAEVARMGWNDTEFDIFRLEVQYPVLHSAAHLCVE